MSLDLARIRAKEIASEGYRNMFVTISLGGEYINSYDITATETTTVGSPTTKEMIQAIQKRLNELGANPRLTEDGILGRRTLNAVMKRLNDVKAATVSRAK